MPSTIKLSAEDCANCSWTPVERTDAFIRYIGHGTHPVTGVEITVEKTEYLGEAELVEQNKAERNATDNARWSSGMGSDRNGNLPMVKVASVPLNVFFDQLAPRLREGDDEFAKWFLSQDQNQPFRTRNGNL